MNNATTQTAMSPLHTDTTLVAYMLSQAEEIRDAMNLLSYQERFDAEDAKESLRNIDEQAELFSLPGLIREAARSQDSDMSEEEQVSALLVANVIENAVAQFMEGNTRAILCNDEPFKNDANGFDHTQHNMVFQDGCNTFVIRPISVETRDTTGWDYDISDYHDEYGIAELNGTALSDNVNELVDDFAQEYGRAASMKHVNLKSAASDEEIQDAFNTLNANTPLLSAAYVQQQTAILAEREKYGYK